ncbi:MAG TPA: class I SAM-dependent methyltransferase [Armatimonadota bacterium]|nr:class I SAM-dependent methyltransferase [Armatimonadota bacterium]
MENVNPGPNDRVLDVGVEAIRNNEFSNLFETLYPYPKNLIALSYLDPEAVKDFYPGVRFVCGDGRRLPFLDKSFDIAVSNAVLEHVGNTADQASFVREMCRVAHKVFITTPNRHFPVELHSRLPFVQYMPRPIRNWMLARAGRQYMIPLWGESFNLLSKRQFRALFPSDVRVRIIGQRVTLLAETLIAIVSDE